MGTWMPGPDLPRDTVGGALVQMTNSFLIVGGRMELHEHTDKILQYDPTDRSWIEREETLDPGTSDHGATLVEDDFFKCA